MLIKSILAAVILIGTIFAVAWYLPKTLQIKKRLDRINDEGIVFYEDRNSLKLERGDLTELIRKSEYVWISCFTASSFEQDPVLRMHKVNKLILYDPEYELLKVYAAMEGDVNKVKALQNSIISVTVDALHNNVLVYWVKRPLMNVVIANAESTQDETKWAKIETFIPYYKAGDRPSYIITRNGYPGLFNRLVQSFNAVTENKTTTIDLMNNRQVLEDAKRNFGWSLKST